MKKFEIAKRGFCLSAWLALVLLPGCVSNTGEVQSSLGQEFSLAIGQTEAITGENLKVKFVEVVGDSRCPTGVVCIWAGEVSLIVDITDSNGLQRVTLTQPGLSGDYASKQYQEYQFTFKVTPYPEAGKTIAPDEYRLLLSVSKLR